MCILDQANVALETIVRRHRRIQGFAGRFDNDIDVFQGVRAQPMEIIEMDIYAYTTFSMPIVKLPKGELDRKVKQAG